MSSGILGQSLTSLVRRAEQVLAERTGPVAVPPAVLWQAPLENFADFDARVERARLKLAGQRLLLAVCGPQACVPREGVRWVQLPPKLLALLNPRLPARYRVAYGGRGSSKSWSFARALIVRALERSTRVLCARELQGSIRESVHRLLSDQIEQLGLLPWFEIQQTVILGANDSEFIFEGVRSNPTQIKSMEGLDIVWGEEAEKFSELSWGILIPTIRKPGSEIWATFNPDQASDPTYARFVTSPPPGALVEFVNWHDNPWFPAELAAEREYLERVDPDTHAWVWGGACRAATDAQIFRGKFAIEAFEPVQTVKATQVSLIFPPGVGYFRDSRGSEYRRTDVAGLIAVDASAVAELTSAGFVQTSAQATADAPKSWDGPYLGADWGFSQDPTVLIKCWIHGRTLYIEHEAYRIGADIDRTPALFDEVPGAREHTIRGDNARPETISYMQQHGYGRLQAVEKWSGSVEDGIAHIRQYERVVIHPRCVHTIEEFRLYSYKVDRLSNDVLPDVLDAHNHTIDALRYALQPIIRLGKNMGMLVFMRQEVEAMKTRAAAGAQ